MEDACCPYCGQPLCAHADENGFYRCPPRPGWRARLARKLADALAKVSTWIGGQ